MLGFAPALPSFTLLVATIILLHFFLRKDRYQNRKGYIVLRNTHKGRMLEHRKVAEDILWRDLLKTEVVHHINFKRDDNRPENLCVMGAREHYRFHRRLEYLWERNIYLSRKVQERKLVAEFGGILLKDVIRERKERRLKRRKRLKKLFLLWR